MKEQKTLTRTAILTNFSLFGCSTQPNWPVSECLDSQFDCGDGQCLYETFNCDGSPHCDNERDEANCPSKLKISWEFICLSKTFFLLNFPLCFRLVTTARLVSEMHSSFRHIAQIKYQTSDIAHQIYLLLISDHLQDFQNVQVVMMKKMEILDQ